MAIWRINAKCPHGWPAQIDIDPQTRTFHFPKCEHLDADALKKEKLRKREEERLIKKFRKQMKRM